MKNTSLLKITVTVAVVTLALASSFINAEDKVNKIVETTQADIVKSARQLDFSTVIEKLDSDKNGMISQTEVTVAQGDLLRKEFNKIDVNQDKQIDKTELNNYFAEIKVQATDAAKSAI